MKLILNLSLHKGYRLLLALALAGLLSCSGDLPSELGSLQRLQGAETLPKEPSSAPPLTVQFLGAGGIYLHYRDQSLLGDPFFSNPPLSHWLTLRNLKSRTDVIDAHLPPLDQVQAILVGHGHFDHVMDIPYIAGQLPDSVKIYGSDTVHNQLTPELPTERLVGLDAKMARNQSGGEWVSINPQLRILPVYSEHSPHFGETVLASTTVQQPLQERPQDALDWKAGPNLNYVIDFLQPNETGTEPRVAFRVFYQSSSSGSPVGFPPQWLLDDGVPFDLALLCAANYNHVQGYPQGILALLKPRAVMLIHWEQFWEEYRTDRASPLPGLDFAELERRIRSVLDANVPVRLPNRGASFELGARP